MHYMKLGINAVQGFGNRNLVEQLHHWKRISPSFSLKKKKRKKEKNKIFPSAQIKPDVKTKKYFYNKTLIHAWGTS